MHCFYIWCLGNLGVGINEMGQMNFEPDKDFEQKPPSKELSEYLKKKLRDRGILKDNSNKGDLVSSYFKLVLWFGETKI